MIDLDADGHNPTVYDSLAELRFDEDNPYYQYFDDEVKCCDNCIHFDGRYCTKELNNLDDTYLIPERDKRSGNDLCDDYEPEGEP